MDLLGLVIALGTGLLAGSFLNVVSDRTKQGKSFLTGRSRCDFCHKDLRPNDLIPVFSFLINKGKCSFCNKKISIIYPLSELFTAFVYALIYFYLQQNSLTWEYYLFFYLNFSILIIVFFHDYKFYEIPFNLIIIGSVFSLIYRILVLNNLTSANFLIELASWLGIFLFYYLIIIFSKGGMGGGDLKLSVYLGIFLGLPTSIYAIYYGFLSGGIFALILLMLGKKGLKAKIPFGPFLVIGSLISLFFILY